MNAFTNEESIVLASLAPLFAEADKTGKWFYCGYQGIWFTADELRAAQAEGRFVWGAVNWKLRDPQEQLDNLRRQINRLEAEVTRFTKRMTK